MKERKIFEIIKNLNKLFIQLNPVKNTLISVIDYKQTDGGDVFKIWLSIFPSSSKEKVINELQSQQKKIKNLLKQLRFRKLPRKIVLIPSEGYQEVEQIYQVIKEIQNEISNNEKEK